MFTVHFDVSVPFALHDDQFVFVTGSHEHLGNWETGKALKLDKRENGRWVGLVNLGADVLKFRYFIGYYLQSEEDKGPVLAVSKWETHSTPRCVMPPVEASTAGICRANLRDIFGFSGGREFFSDGWVLTDEMHQILMTVSGEALKFYKQKHIREEYRLKMVPFDLRRNRNDASNAEDDEEPTVAAMDELPPLTHPALPSHSPTEIASLSLDAPKFRDQEEFGEPFHNKVDYFMFRTQSVAVEFLSFRLEVYLAKSDKLVALGYALPSTLHDTFGRTSVPLLTKLGVPVGKVYFSYLFIRPLRLPHPNPTMHNCYAKHWKKRSTLEVGHRGMGNSYTKCAVARENTLHSLSSAYKNGADLVEFDVHLTKDKIPIIYHDFHVMVWVAKRLPTATTATGGGATNGQTDSESDDGKKQQGPKVMDFYQLAVKDLELKKLRLLHLDHVKVNENSLHSACDSENHRRVTGAHDEAEEHRPFPTLSEAFQALPDVGFNIEVKYPQLQVDQTNECEGVYFERNEFVDIILSNVLSNAGRRRIVFSSFDADICTMLSVKQKKYPVLFLCLGDSSRHVQYADERTRLPMSAVKFAHAIGIVGVNFNTEDLMKDASPVGKSKELGLISFVWGDELVERKTVDYFKKTLVVEGIIYDRIGEGEVRTNVFTLEKAKKNELFSQKKPSIAAVVAQATPPRCFSHHHLNNNNNNAIISTNMDTCGGAETVLGRHRATRGSRNRSTSAWSSTQESTGTEMRSACGSDAMFSIGELDSSLTSSSSASSPFVFPTIRRHNSTFVGANGESLERHSDFVMAPEESRAKRTTTNGTAEGNQSEREAARGETISQQTQQRFTVMTSEI
ncbi:hypothetical protein niasHS_002776 [Heterodera schachtii]|uniref:Glycerophosphocholine phosphodiesterase GPCPD1 n=1 Tax=Heterodera schachtii TaxID=97005 RepID=A0ABD2K2T7_HETSC